MTKKPPISVIHSYLLSPLWSFKEASDFRKYAIKHRPIAKLQMPDEISSRSLWNYTIEKCFVESVYYLRAGRWIFDGRHRLTDTSTCGSIHSLRTNMKRIRHHLMTSPQKLIKLHHSSITETPSKDASLQHSHVSDWGPVGGNAQPCGMKQFHWDDWGKEAKQGTIVISQRVAVLAYSGCQGRYILTLPLEHSLRPIAATNFQCLSCGKALVKMSATMSLMRT